MNGWGIVVELWISYTLVLEKKICLYVQAQHLNIIVENLILTVLQDLLDRLHKVN